MSFTIICHLQLYVIYNYMSFRGISRQLLLKIWNLAFLSPKMVFSVVLIKTPNKWNWAFLVNFLKWQKSSQIVEMCEMNASSCERQLHRIQKRERKILIFEWNMKKINPAYSFLLCGLGVVLQCIGVIDCTPLYMFVVWFGTYDKSSSCVNILNFIWKLFCTDINL